MNDVTTTSHPTLYKAFDMISHDIGNGSGWLSYPMPDRWWQYVDDTETALLTLSPEDFKTFCIGDSEEMMKIAKRSTHMYLVSMMLNAFASEADYWPHPYMVAGD